MNHRTRCLFSLVPIALVFLLGGCLLDYAPSGPSRSNNTWLLGVWEAEGEKGNTYRAVVTPSTSQRMTVFFTEKNKQGKTVQSGQYQSWISRVGSASLLVFEIPEEGGPRYLVLGFQLMDPLKVRLREVTLDSSKPLGSSFRTRVEIRRQFALGELFRGKQVLWHKTGEIFWEPEKDGGDPARNTFTPTRNLPRGPLTSAEEVAP